MSRNYFLWIVILALGCLFLIFFSVGREINKPLIKEPISPSPVKPFSSYISGVGIAEASSENMSIGAPLNRIVDKVLVKVGEKVNKGEILFTLENRDLKANVNEQQIAYNTALAKLKRLEAFPRPEDLAESEASLKKAQAALELAKKQYDMVLALSDPRAISQEMRNQRLNNYQQAQAKYEQALSDLDKIKAGTWQPDLDIAKLEVERAKANTKRIETEIQRTIIRSPIDGTVLQIKIHEGESPSQDSRTPLMIIGDIDKLYLRVSINQLDIPNFNSNAPAVAYPQGNINKEYPLEFVRVEPYLVHKQNLTNEIIEKVDTRVLQILYLIKKENPDIFVGQQMDVYIESKVSP